MKVVILLLVGLSTVLCVSELANYPLITLMKSGDHKLLTASTTGTTSLVYDQSFFLTFSNLPNVAISLRDFQVQGAVTNSSVTSNELNYKCTIGSITTSSFRTTLDLTSTNTFSLLYYMYIGIDLVQWGFTYMYFYSIDTSSQFNDTAGVTNIQSKTIS